LICGSPSSIGSEIADGRRLGCGNRNERATAAYYNGGKKNAYVAQLLLRG
jgi:hypothetical protein